MVIKLVSWNFVNLMAFVIIYNEHESAQEELMGLIVSD